MFSGMTVFICSSFLEIHEILYNIKKKQLKDFKIIVTTNKQAFFYFQNIFSPDKIIFLNSGLQKNPKNILSWIKEFIILSKVYFWKFSKNVENIYFNAPTFDLIAINLVFNSFRNSKIFLLRNTYEQMFQEFEELQQKSILCKMYSFFYNIPISTYKSYFQEIYGDVFGISRKEFNDRFILVEKTDKSELKNNKKYLLRYTDHDISNSYIILSYDDSSQSRLFNYDELIFKTLKILRGEKVFLKKHYTQQVSQKNKFNLTELNMNYPIELYDLSNCKGVICIFTSGIEKILFDEVKKICLYELAQFKTNQERDNWNNYINHRFDTSSCFFPETFNEFESILKADE